MDRFLKSYFSILIDNFKFYKYTEYNINFVIKLFNKYYKELESYINSNSESIYKLIKWLDENPYAPLYAPSKQTEMFKKRQMNYSNININQSNLNQCNLKINKIDIQSYKEKSKARKDNLNDIIKSNEFLTLGNITEDNKLNYNSDEDLTDFSFSLNDLIHFE